MSPSVLDPPTLTTVAELLEALGDIPPERVRLQPHPGTATEADVLEIHAREKRLCELVDGTLVEKPTGYDESRLAVEIVFILVGFLHQHDLGTVAGEAGMMRLLTGLVASRMFPSSAGNSCRRSMVRFLRWRRTWPSRS
jgi:hypothetical protein